MEMMKLLILDKQLNVVGICDDYRSCIWTDRFQDAGDFEIFLPISSSIAQYINLDYYVTNSLSDHVMVIEQIEIQTDPEDGNFLIFSGRSVEVFLTRRIVWNQTEINGLLQDGIKRLITDAFINPTDADRKVDNFIFVDSTDPAVTAIELNAQYTGDELFKVVQEACNECNLGFRISLTEDNKWAFSLYAGLDRSYKQLENEFVIFSQMFDNIVNSNYIKMTKDWKTVTLVAGEGEGAARITEVIGGGSGIDRRELFTDARDIRAKDDNNNDIPIATYRKNLQNRGTEKLAEAKKTTLLDGEVEASSMFQFGRDFAMGDIVQLENTFGLKGTARITEMIFSSSDTEYKNYPTFTMIEEETDD